MDRHPHRRNHTGEEIDWIAGGASGMGVDRIDEVGDRASERQAAGVYEAGQGGWGTRFVLTRLEGWQKVTEGSGEEGCKWRIR